MRIVLAVLSVLLAAGLWALGQSNALPRADFKVSPANLDTNTLVTFDASASKDPDGTIVKYEWDFNGDGRFDEVKATPITTRLFDRGGDWRINLRVTDNRGGLGSISKIVKVTEAPVTTRRSIALPPGGHAAPGQTVRVVVQLRINQTVNGLGLDEDPPAGWTVREAQSAGGILKKTELQWLWTQRFTQGQTLTIAYDLVVPSGVSAPVFIISGRVTSFSPRLAAPIVGDTEIRVSR